MPLRIFQTTDGKYIGEVLSVDPRDPPEEVSVDNGVLFEPLEWSEAAPGKWRIRNPHYCVWAEEV